MCIIVFIVDDSVNVSDSSILKNGNFKNIGGVHSFCITSKNIDMMDKVRLYVTKFRMRRV